MATVVTKNGARQVDSAVAAERVLLPAHECGWPCRDCGAITANRTIHVYVGGVRTARRLCEGCRPKYAIARKRRVGRARDVVTVSDLAARIQEERMLELEALYADSLPNRGPSVSSLPRDIRRLAAKAGVSLQAALPEADDDDDD